MARNGSGTYTLPYPSFATGTTISSEQFNANNADLQTAMTGSLPRDGQAAPTANIPFGAYKITGLGSGSAATDSANLGQVQAQAFIYCSVGGTADAIELTTSPAITAYAAGQTFRFIATGDNTDAVTVSVSALATKDLKKTSSGAAAELAAGDLKEGSVYQIIYDGTQFRLFDSVSDLYIKTIVAGTGVSVDDTDPVNPVVSSVGFSTGDVKLTLKTTADSGWVMCNDGTIGDASSGGTTRASADTEDLYTLLWTNVSDTYAAVTGGRGASAAADFAAHKPIALTKMLGRALALSGAGSGLTSRALGQYLGNENLQQHTHTVTDPGHAHQIPYQNGYADGPVLSGRNSYTTTAYQPTQSATTGITIQNAGTGTAGNMQPTSFLNAMIKL